MRNRLKAKRQLRVIAVWSALLILSTIAGRKGAKADALSELLGVQTVSLPGALGDINQVKLSADGRYAVVAPFAPVHGADNHFVDVTDLQNSLAPPTQIDLGNYYYPTNLFVTQDNIVFVRVTGFDPNDPNSLPSEGILFFRLSTDPALTQPTGDGFTFLPISRPAGSTDNSVVPVDFGVGRMGQLVVFTNGASVDLVSPDGNYSYQFPIIRDDQYKPLTDPQDTTADYYAITRLDVDPATDIITITVNRRIGGVNSSSLYFYQMYESGANFGNVERLRLVTYDQLPAGTSMTPGSNAISPDGNFGYFVTDDGSLCRVALDGNVLDTEVDLLGTYASVAAIDPANRGSRILQYDRVSKSLGIIDRGKVVQIRRPGSITRPAYISGRGRITRPAYVTIEEAPGLVLSTLGLDGSISNAREFVNFGSGEVGISNVVFDRNGAALLTNYSGNLLSIGNSGMNGMGKSVARIGQLTFAPGGSSLLGISSFSVDSSGNQDMTDPGSLVIMNIQDPPIGAP